MQVVVSRVHPDDRGAFPRGADSYKRELEDPRRIVTLREPGTPWPIKFGFLIVRDSDGEAVDYVNFSFELGEDEVPEKPARAVDALTLRRIAANYGSYLEIARGAFVLDLEGLRGAVDRLRTPGRKPARLGDDFYRLFAADYETHLQAGGFPGKELAVKYNCNPGNISKWKKEARRRGYLRRYELRVPSYDGSSVSPIVIERTDPLETGKPFTQGTTVYMALEVTPGSGDLDAIVTTDKGHTAQFVRDEQA